MVFSPWREGFGLFVSLGVLSFVDVLATFLAAITDGGDGTSKAVNSSTAFEVNSVGGAIYRR